MKLGAPVIYDEETQTRLTDEICAIVASGKSLLRTLKENPQFPSRETFYVWLLNRKDLSDKYARATELRAEILFDEMLEISDTPQPLDTEIQEDGTNGSRTQRIRQDATMHRRTQIDTRKWILARMNPRKYGDRVMTEDVTEKPKTLVLVKKEPNNNSITK